MQKGVGIVARGGREEVDKRVDGGWKMQCYECTLWWGSWCKGKLMGINLVYKVVAEGDTVKHWKAIVKGNKKDNMRTEQRESVKSELA